jgi:peptidoglycan/LPS O-acetylase OafA/YrhL
MQTVSASFLKGSPVGSDPPRRDLAPARANTPGTAFRFGHEPALDGLRSVAVLVVMIGHLSLIGAGADLSHLGSSGPGPCLRGGFLGVDIFFVLSGFLITTLLVKEHQRTGHISLRAFYQRRVLRLLPAFVVLLAVCSCYVLAQRCAAETRPVTRGIVFGLGCNVNNYCWIKGCHAGMLTHLWSLGVEEQFYCLWPVLLCVLLRRPVRRRWILLAVVLAITGSGLLRLAFWHSGLRHGKLLAMNSLPTRVDNLLMGALLALLACWGGLPRSLPGRALTWAVAWGGAALLASLLWSSDAGPRAYSLTGLAATLVLGGLISGQPPLLRRALAAWPLAWVGRISYSLYLWHVPVFCLGPALLSLSLGRGYESVRLGWQTWFAFSILLAALSYYLVERPFLRWKARLSGC